MLFNVSTDDLEDEEDDPRTFVYSGDEGPVDGGSESGSESTSGSEVARTEEQQLHGPYRGLGGDGQRGRDEDGERVEYSATEGNTTGGRETGDGDNGGGLEGAEDAAENVTESSGSDDGRETGGEENDGGL